MYTALGNAVADVADSECLHLADTPHPLLTCKKRLLRDDQSKLRPISNDVFSVIVRNSKLLPEDA